MKLSPQYRVAPVVEAWARRQEQAAWEGLLDPVAPAERRGPVASAARAVPVAWAVLAE